MKILPSQLTLLSALACMTCAHAAGMTQGSVIRDYTDVVAPAEQQAYEAGEKALNKCFHEHGVKYTWTAWTHSTGNTYAYSYVSDPLTWADFDAMHAAGLACQSVITTAVNPHLQSETSAFYVLHPGLSYMSKEATADEQLIEVVSFKLKSGEAAYKTFMSDVKLIYAAFEKTHRPDYSMTLDVTDAGSDAPDFIIVIPQKSWADLGKDINPPLWTVMANVYGPKKAQSIHKSLDAVIAESSVHVDRYNADLTYTAGH